VTVTSTPSGAEIWRGGTNTGFTTEHTFDGVPPGMVFYTLKLDGQDEQAVSGTVEAGGKLVLAAALKSRARTPEAALATGGGWENPLGMPFVPAGTPSVLFCIWETRVKDFRAFVEATGYDAVSDSANGAPADTLEESNKLKKAGGSWKDPRFPPGHQQDDRHPVTCVSYLDAEEFCKWLTKRDRSVLPAGWSYRLPTDEEWSTACGPAEFPWGNDWPPGATAGNYSGTEAMIGPLEGYTNDLVKAGRSDGWARTAPVGSFTPNDRGLFDMGGNVWEWCSTWYTASMNTREALEAPPALKDDGGGRKFRVLRGASWFDLVRVNMRSGDRNNDDGLCLVSVQPRGEQRGPAARVGKGADSRLMISDCWRKAGTGCPGNGLGLEVPATIGNHGV